MSRMNDRHNKKMLKRIDRMAADYGKQTIKPAEWWRERLTAYFIDGGDRHDDLERVEGETSDEFASRRGQALIQRLVAEATRDDDKLPTEEAETARYYAEQIDGSPEDTAKWSVIDSSTGEAAADWQETPVTGLTEAEATKIAEAWNQLLEEE